MYHVFQFWDIKCFYNTALRISDSDLESVSWWDVQQRLLAAQTEHMMCIHKERISFLFFDFFCLYLGKMYKLFLKYIYCNIFIYAMKYFFINILRWSIMNKKLILQI